ncbi:ABC transporter ATP-binding protein [Novosphingobium huizhouense]|uniref:ABC transporter ATP-binding protein n=1 Tax=Novosphingobium huizhouense TaxID=2866625 RepID=UPI001CD8520B|nr:ABC transporter ATP-binding protein [Novosphingobium huizhouense]
MIIARNLSKRYVTAHGAGRWVIDDVSFTIPPRLSVGLVGSNGAGKSTLLRILAGVDKPTRGEVERRCRVSWPLGFGGGLQGTLTARQNAKFVCRIHGHEDDIPERMARIEEFAALGKAFDEPIRTYSSGMAARLRFAISLAFDFDVYISDEATSAGDAAFRKRAADEFRRRANEASVIMVSHDPGTLRKFCTAGMFLSNGKAHWFDDLEDALKAYKESTEQ